MIHRLCFSKLCCCRLRSQLSLFRVIQRQWSRCSFSNIQRVTFITRRIQSEALIRRQELNTKTTTTESSVIQKTHSTCSFMSKHIHIHGADTETDAIVLQINFSSEKVSRSCTLLSAVAQAPTICNSLGLCVCARQHGAQTKRKN